MPVDPPLMAPDRVTVMALPSATNGPVTALLTVWSASAACGSIPPASTSIEAPPSRAARTLPARGAGLTPLVDEGSCGVAFCVPADMLFASLKLVRN